MSELSGADRERLAKLLALLGSDHVGERDAAALAAHRLLQKRGLSWREALGVSSATPRAPATGAASWRSTAARCLEFPGSLRPWERGFLRGLQTFTRLSEKQSRILQEIADRVLNAEATH